MVIGDTHGNAKVVRDVLRVAGWSDADAVLSVGDFGVWPGGQGKYLLDVVDEMARARRIRVLIVPGNHDDYDQIHAAPVNQDGWYQLRPHVLAAPRPHTWTWDGVRLLAFGGTASIDGPDGTWSQVRGPTPDGRDLGAWWRDERITDAQVNAALDLVRTAGPVDVMITHDAPAGVPLTGTPFPAGDEQRTNIRQVVDAARPRHLLCGHWHRFAQHRLDNGTHVTVLADDLTRDEPQYAWLHLTGGHATVEVPAPWQQMIHGLPLTGPQVRALRPGR